MSPPGDGYRRRSGRGTGRQQYREEGRQTVVCLTQFQKMSAQHFIKLLIRFRFYIFLAVFVVALSKSPGEPTQST